jgi:hypothetical protein
MPWVFTIGLEVILSAVKKIKFPGVFRCSLGSIDCIALLFDYGADDDGFLRLLNLLALIACR